jgi:hypothetical protein
MDPNQLPERQDHEHDIGEDLERGKDDELDAAGRAGSCTIELASCWGFFPLPVLVVFTWIGHHLPVELEGRAFCEASNHGSCKRDCQYGPEDLEDLGKFETFQELLDHTHDDAFLQPDAVEKRAGENLASNLSS